MADLLTGQSAEEQAAQRRVATLVARGVESAVVFGAVADEVAALCDADIVAIVRHEPGGDSTVMAGHGLARAEPGTRFKLDPSWWRAAAGRGLRDPGSVRDSQEAITIAGLWLGRDP